MSASPVVMNAPLRQTVPAPAVTCAAYNVILETLKPAEDGRGYIVRLYEADRRIGGRCSFGLGTRLRPWSQTACWRRTARLRRSKTMSFN